MSFVHELVNHLQYVTHESQELMLKQKIIKERFILCLERYRKFHSHYLRYKKIGNRGEL